MSYVGFERVRTYHHKAEIERICRYCQRAQPLEDFCANQHCARGRTWECKCCRSKRRKRAALEALRQELPRALDGRPGQVAPGAPRERGAQA